MISSSELIMAFLLNAAWQICVVVALASLFDYLLRNAAASYRHALWVMTLVACLALPVWSVVRSEQTAIPSLQFSTASQTTEPALKVPATYAPLPDEPPALQSPNESPSAAPPLPSKTRSLAVGPLLATLLGVAYLLFVGFRVVRFARLWLRTQKLRRQIHIELLSARVATCVERCSSALRVSHAGIAFSSRVAAPATMGVTQPVVILPAHFQNEDANELWLSVLGHELAHIARRDYLFNIIYELLLLPIAFHPLVKFTKRQIDRTRELACDELVTARLIEPVAHARSLIRVAESLLTPAQQVLTLGIFDANILEERIVRLTRSSRRLSTVAGRALLIAATCLLSISIVTISKLSFVVTAAETSTTPVALVAVDQASLSESTAATDIPADVLARPTAGTRPQQQSNSSSAQERAQYACNLTRKDAPEAIPQLIAMLGDDSKTELLKCWDNLWSPALATFKQPSPGEQAAIALASMGRPAFPPLTAALSDPNASVRRNAAWAIGELTNMLPGERGDAVLPLVALLGDSDAWVRRAAARALGELADRRASDRLIAALLDSDAGVRELSSWALGEMKDDSAVLSLCRVVVSDNQPQVRLEAAKALGEIRSEAAVAALTEALNDSEPLVRAKARWALAEIQDSDD